MISFEVNKEKVLNAVLFLIREANSRGKNPSQYDLVKALFLADRGHLNKYGRPITFDRYVAMIHGPVPSFSYDMLKPGFNWGTCNLRSAPWNAVADNKVHRFSLGDNAPDIHKLSLSDQEFLTDAIATTLSLTFGQIRKLTHEDLAYIAAWKDEEGTSAFDMDMALLLDDYSSETIDDIRYLAEMTAA